jgi:hypothetical protein
MVSCDWLRCSMAVLAIAGGFMWVAPVMAQSEPSTRPARPMLERRGDQQPQRPWRERLGSYDPSAGTGPLTEQEVVEIRQFMETHSPRRMRRLEDVPRERQGDIYDRIRAQYHAMQRLKEQDPQIYELRLKRLPIEDEMFALGWRLKHDEELDGKTAQELRAKLREQMRQFVENSLEERRLRLARAQELFEQLKRNKEALIEKGVAGIENERGDVLRDLALPVFPAQRAVRAPAADNRRDEPDAP